MSEQTCSNAETENYLPHKALSINPLEEQKYLEQSTKPAEGMKTEYLQQHPYVTGTSLQRTWEAL